MKVIFIAGSWGSGTTAVIGALDRLGVATLEPHFISNDAKTTNTFELVPFRDLILKHVDQQTIKHKENYQRDFLPALEAFREQMNNNSWPGQPENASKILALKMPLASVCISEITQAFETKLIVVHRPLEDIEASRVRRNWPRLFGSLGAQYIYNQIFSDIIKHKLSFLGISHGDFVNNTRLSLQRIINFCDIQHLEGNIDKADTFVRKPG